ARALLDHFGTRDALDELFSWIESTLLSRAHERDKDWPLFLANTTTPARIAAWCAGRAQAAGAAAIPPAALADLTPRARAALDALLRDPGEARARELFFPPARARREL